MRIRKIKKSRIMLVALVIFTMGAAVLHLTTRQEAIEGNLQIVEGENIYTIELAELDYEQVTGTRVNGKGEEIVVDAPGILVSSILAQENIQGYSEIAVVADDSYSARLTADEVETKEKAYLICDDDELRLIVFGDDNSKRSVTNVVQIVVK